MTETAISSTALANWQAAELLIASCLEQGVDHFFIAPGSRCTPLTLAVAQRKDLHVIQHFDERGLAFAAIGYGRATGRCAAIVCTSGTAVANLLPAVVEASLDHVPLLLFTADRPPELRDQGSNQAIDQVKIFQQYVRWFSDLPCPEADLKPTFWRSQVRHAIARTTTGPVHLNCMFREPFGLPSHIAPTAADFSNLQAPSANNELSPFSTTTWKVPPGNTIVVAGGCTRAEALAAEQLATRLHAPFFSDISNGVRGEILPWQFARPDNPQAEVVIHVGQRIVTKRWWSFLEAHPPQHYVHLTRFEDRFDPIHQVTQTMVGCLQALCRGAERDRPVSSGFRQEWLGRANRVRTVVDRVLDEHPDLSEPQVARRLSQQLPPNTGLFLGNSLPIRDWDNFGSWPHEKKLVVACNRGASGIDGLLATSAGFARGLRRRTTTVVGDLSALHDLNSLNLIANSPVPVTLIIMNNDGGGIFHFLPIAQQTEHFRSYFVTPHGRTFENAASMFGLSYSHVQTMDELSAAFDRACQSEKSCILEVSTQGPANVALHRAIERAVNESLL